MEINGAERIVIAKPVASKPSCSNFKSFSELLAGAINASPPTNETAIVTAIRPKTVRFKPSVNHPQLGSTSSQADLSGTALCKSSDSVLNSDCKPTVVYKPRAKLVSKATVSLLANMGNFSDINQKQTLPSVDVQVQNQVQDKRNFASHFHQNIVSNAQADQTTEASRLTSNNQEDDLRTLSAASAGDRPSYDGYSWRKYGQKQVKGSEYPRSYYKCTYPNCPVKKKVERSLDGQIAEIVYKGEHNHSKPQPPKRYSSSSGTQVLGIASDGNGQDMVNPTWNNPVNEVSEGRVEIQNELGLATLSVYQSKALHSHDHARIGSHTSGAVPSENSCGLSGDCDDGFKGIEGVEDEPKSKRRKSDYQSNEVGISGGGEAQVAAQRAPETEIVGDGFRWRKYGQKVVKGNPYPRSYYRCTGPKCNVRKYVERVSDDPGAFITTYEGKHNHEMPPSRPTNSDPNSQAQAAAGKGKS